MKQLFLITLLLLFNVWLFGQNYSLRIVDREYVTILDVQDVCMQEFQDKIAISYHGVNDKLKAFTPPIPATCLSQTFFENDECQFFGKYNLHGTTHKYLIQLSETYVVYSAIVIFEYNNSEFKRYEFYLK